MSYEWKCIKDILRKYLRDSLLPLYKTVLEYQETGGIMVNKSHATAYAMVAMFTAYCKEYHTADFFRYSLDATKELKEVPAFLREMPKFGISMKPPTMLESENGFSVEDDGKSLRYSFKRIKGFSEQDIVRNTTAQDFITMNPNVSVKMMETYASLGFFDEAWGWDRKYGRVQGNRHEILRWVRDMADTYKKYLAIREKTDTELAELNQMKEKLSEMNLNTEEGTAYAKEVETFEKSYNKDMAKRDELAKILNDRYKDDKANHMHVKETDKEVLENRAKEVELLSTAFDIDESKKRLEECKNPRTFKALQISRDDNYGQNMVNVPAIVLSVSAEKKTKTSGKSYYEVSLMDREGSIINRRFSSPPEVLDGQFQLTIEDSKYFTCDMTNYKPLLIEKKQDKHEVYSANNANALKALQTGAIQQYPLPGNKHINMVPISEEMEQDGRDDL